MRLSPSMFVWCSDARGAGHPRNPSKFKKKKRERENNEINVMFGSGFFTRVFRFRVSVHRCEVWMWIQSQEAGMFVWASPYLSGNTLCSRPCQIRAPTEGQRNSSDIQDLYQFARFSEALPIINN